MRAHTASSPYSESPHHAEKLIFTFFTSFTHSSQFSNREKHTHFPAKPPKLVSLSDISIASCMSASPPLAGNVFISYALLYVKRGEETQEWKNGFCSSHKINISPFRHVFAFPFPPSHSAVVSTPHKQQQSHVVDTSLLSTI